MAGASEQDSVAHPLIQTLPQVCATKAKHFIAHTHIPAAVWSIPLVAGHILLGTLVWYYLLRLHIHPDASDSPLEDAFYFAVVTFLTIGYGDIAPVTEYAKAFFIVYTVLSLVVQLTLVAGLVHNISLDPGDTDRTHHHANVSTYFKVRPRIMKALQGFGLLLVLVAILAVMLKYMGDPGGKSTETWLDCVYWAVTTIATVGYGDVVPKEHRAEFACIFLLSVVLFAYLLGESVGLLADVHRYRRLDAFFARGLTPEIIDSMDAFRDGRVARVEFMMFILENLNLVGREEMGKILELFDSMDRTRDGFLTLQDAAIHQRDRAALIDGEYVDARRLSCEFQSSLEHVTVDDTSAKDQRPSTAAVPSAQEPLLQGPISNGVNDGVASGSDYANDDGDNATLNAGSVAGDSVYEAAAAPGTNDKLE